MTFHFIDNNAITDHKTRRRIRSHVAKGKNLGRTINRPSRTWAAAVTPNAPPPQQQQQQQQQQQRPPPPQQQQGDEDGNENGNDTEKNDSVLSAFEVFNQQQRQQLWQKHKPCQYEYDAQAPHVVLSVQRQFQEDMLACLPFQATNDCRRLFHFFVMHMNLTPYPPELLSKKVVDLPDGPRMFLQYAFVDEALFHTLVAMSVAGTALPKTQVSPKISAEALQHLSRSLRLINERLRSPHPPSDTTIAVVIALTQHERLLGYHRQGLVHFEGLRKLVEAKGGLEMVTPKIREKAFRADLDFALQFGNPMRFGVAEVEASGFGEETLGWLREEWRASRRRSHGDRSRRSGDNGHDSDNWDGPWSWNEDGGGSEDEAALIPLSIKTPALRRVFEDVATLAWLVDSNPPQTTIHGDEFHCILLLVFYRLFDIRPLCQIMAHLSPSFSASPPSLPNTPSPSSHQSTTDDAATKLYETYVHLGLIAIMMKFFLTGGLKPPDVGFLGSTIYEVLHHSKSNHDDPYSCSREHNRAQNEVTLWLLLAAKSCAFLAESGDEEDVWLIPKVAKVARELGFCSSSFSSSCSSWEDNASPILSKWPWMRVLQDRPARALWEDVVQSNYFNCGPGSLDTDLDQSEWGVL
ncbi:hypothetical protein F5Y16DRAFT_417660 [Xylariaceae sp. FL0255]|nr:hypothetical protein F5Y16DRAFT_417660 [Xylariaceae sp. FL0255]